MGSSAGAGSGEFHVYRHLRRKEYARQKYIQIKSEQELLDEEFEKKLEGKIHSTILKIVIWTDYLGNKTKAEEKTAKKRAKRQKKKQKAKQPRMDKAPVEADASEDDDSGSENSQDINEKTTTEELIKEDGNDNDDNTKDIEAVNKSDV